jgi:hypothetical protein
MHGPTAVKEAATGSASDLKNDHSARSGHYSDRLLARPIHERADWFDPIAERTDDLVSRTRIDAEMLTDSTSSTSVGQRSGYFE